MSQSCPRCYKIVARACQSDTETYDCPNLERTMTSQCAQCGGAIYFNTAIRRWVTKKDRWKCNPTPDLPVRAHIPTPRTKGAQP